MKGVRSRLTYANVMATLALFAALGGGAYAATALPAGSVGTRQLRRGAVTPSKLSHRTRSILGRRGPRGAPGVQGIQGLPGLRGPKGEKGDVGPSHAYSTALGYTSGIGGGKTVGTLPVPAGSYVVVAKVATEASGSGNFQYVVNCNLTAGGDTDSSRIEQAEDGSYVGGDVLPLSLVHRFTAPGSISIDCAGNSPGGAVVTGGRLTAIRVGGLG